MAKTEQNEILKMIEGLSPEEQAAIIQALAKDEPQKKKVRRKHYKKEEQAQIKQPEPQEQQKQRRKRPFVNEFEKSPLFDAHKEDRSVDKKLWSGHEPIERDRPPARYVKVNCAGCNKPQQVLSSHIHKTGRGGPDETSDYYCNNCITKRKR